MAALQAHDWPGNVRELRNVIERVMILAPSDRLGRIDADMLPSELVRGGTDILPGSESITAIPLKEAREAWTEQFELVYLKSVLERSGGNVTHAARASGIAHRYFQLVRARSRGE